MARTPKDDGMCMVELFVSFVFERHEVVLSSEITSWTDDYHVT